MVEQEVWPVQCGFDNLTVCKLPRLCWKFCVYRVGCGGMTCWAEFLPSLSRQRAMLCVRREPTGFVLSHMCV